MCRGSVSCRVSWSHSFQGLEELILEHISAGFPRTQGWITTTPWDTRCFQTSPYRSPGKSVPMPPIMYKMGTFPGASGAQTSSSWLSPVSDIRYSLRTASCGPSDQGSSADRHLRVVMDNTRKIGLIFHYVQFLNRAEILMFINCVQYCLL